VLDITRYDLMLYRLPRTKVVFLYRWPTWVKM